MDMDLLAGAQGPLPYMSIQKLNVVGNDFILALSLLTLVYSLCPLAHTQYRHRLVLLAKEVMEIVSESTYRYTI